MTSLKYLWKQSIFLLLAVWRHHPEFWQHPHSLLPFSCSDILPSIKKSWNFTGMRKKSFFCPCKMSCILKKPFSIQRCEFIKMYFHISVYLNLQNQMTLKTYTKKFKIEKYKYWLMIWFHVFTFCKLSLSCVLELNEFPATMTLHISAQWLCSSLLPSIPVTMSTNSWRLKICSSLLPISSPDIRTKYLKTGKKKIILFSVKITQKISKWTGNLIFLLSFKFVIF